MLDYMFGHDGSHSLAQVDAAYRRHWHRDRLFLEYLLGYWFRRTSAPAILKIKYATAIAASIMAFQTMRLCSALLTLKPDTYFSLLIIAAT
jgi:hypothetical protein